MLIKGETVNQNGVKLTYWVSLPHKKYDEGELIVFYFHKPRYPNLSFLLKNYELRAPLADEYEIKQVYHDMKLPNKGFSKKKIELASNRRSEC